MQGDTLSIDEKLTLRSVAAVLAAAEVGAVLVRCDDGRVGIVSERDVTRALAQEADPDTIWSIDIMTEDLVTADVGEQILRVAVRLLDEGIRHIALTKGAEIIGVVSAREVFAVLTEDAIENG